MALRSLRAVYILAVLAGVVGCMQGNPSPPPPLVAIANPQPEGQQSEKKHEGTKAESKPSSDSAVSLGLLIDVSGSMRTKMDWVVEALQTFINSLQPQDEVFLFGFTHIPAFLQPFTADRAVLNEALSALRAKVRPVGGTALYDAVLKGLDLVGAGKRPHKALLVLTDGRDTASLAPLGQVLQAAERAKVPIYSIGIGDPRASPPKGVWAIGPFIVGGSPYEAVDVHTLQTLSESTKGSYFILNVTDPAGHTAVLTQALNKISQELRQSPAGPGAP